MMSRILTLLTSVIMDMGLS